MSSKHELIYTINYGAVDVKARGGGEEEGGANVSFIFPTVGAKH